MRQDSGAAGRMEREGCINRVSICQRPRDRERTRGELLGEKGRVFVLVGCLSLRGAAAVFPARTGGLGCLHQYFYLLIIYTVDP